MDNYVPSLILTLLLGRSYPLDVRVHVHVPLNTLNPTNLRSSGLLLGQGCEPQVRLDDAEVREKLLGLVVVDSGVNNDIITRDPTRG